METEPVSKYSPGRSQKNGVIGRSDPLINQIGDPSQSALPQGPETCLESPSNAWFLPAGHTDAVPADSRQNASRHLANWRAAPCQDGITLRERPAPLRGRGWNDVLGTDDWYLSVGQPGLGGSLGLRAVDDLIQEGGSG